MAALNFPTSPTLNQVFTSNGKSWRWDGTAWKTFNTTSISSGGTGLTSITSGNAFLSSNSAGTALTYRTFSAGTGVTLNVTSNNVEFSAITTAFITGSGTSSFVPIFTGGTGLTDSIMQQYDATIIVSGQIKAITKSFKIPHPLDPKKQLEHGSLEGPEHGAYQRGSGSGYDQVEIILPKYWSSLVENNYSIIITSKCNYNLYVLRKNENSFIIRRIGRSIFSKKYIEFDYFVIGERKDTKIDVEQDIN
jgi:hypothetical protein